MHEALCRSSGTTLDSVHAEDGPPITQRTSGLSGPVAEGSWPRVHRSIRFRQISRRGFDRNGAAGKPHQFKAIDFQLLSHETSTDGDSAKVTAQLLADGEHVTVMGEGNGPIAAFVHALHQSGAPRFEVADFKQHALSAGTEASAIAYIQIRLPDGKTKWGAGVDTNIELASIKAVLGAVNRAAGKAVAVA